jgi:hypothetical protein
VLEYSECSAQEGILLSESRKQLSRNPALEAISSIVAASGTCAGRGTSTAMLWSWKKTYIYSKAMPARYNL